MTDYLWPAVALVALVLAFIALMRWLGNTPRDRFESLERELFSLRDLHALHVKAFNNICIEWRQKVAELEAKCDKVVVDAKNEIAGDLATVQNITSKGWR